MILSTPLELPRHPSLRLAVIAGKGRGLVAVGPIAEDELIEVAPVIPFREEDRPMPPSLLYGFAFHWPDPPFVEAMVLGAVSLVNHADDPNAWFEPSIEEQVLRLWALRDIAAGEEITIAYGIPLWFEPVT